jgi:hypothetical protein
MEHRACLQAMELGNEIKNKLGLYINQLPMLSFIKKKKKKKKILGGTCFNMGF